MAWWGEKNDTKSNLSIFRKNKWFSNGTRREEKTTNKEPLWRKYIVLYWIIEWLWSSGLCVCSFHAAVALSVHLGALCILVTAQRLRVRPCCACASNFWQHEAVSAFIRLCVGLKLRTSSASHTFPWCTTAARLYRTGVVRLNGSSHGGCLP